MIICVTPRLVLKAFQKRSSKNVLCNVEAFLGKGTSFLGERLLKNKEALIFTLVLLLISALWNLSPSFS